MARLKSSPAVPNPGVVLDASAVIAFAVSSESLHRNAVALVRQLAAQGAILVAPTLFDYEVATVLRLKVFRHITKVRDAMPFTEADAQTVEAVINALQVNTIHDSEVIEAASVLARDFGRAAIYDASYAALAQSRRLDYWTADEDFYLAVNGPALPAHKRLPFVHYLGSVPLTS